MDLRGAPARPPPPPPPPASPPQPLRIPERRQDVAAPEYADSLEEHVTSPPSFAEALMAPSPASPPDYTPYSPGSEPLGRRRGPGVPSPRYTDDDGARYPDEPAYAADSGDEREASSAAAASGGQRKRQPQPQQRGGYRDDEGEGQGDEGHEDDGDGGDEDEDEDIPDLPPVIIVTGACSGLGLALFQHFAAREPARPDAARYDVVGIDKSPWRLPGKGFQWRTTIGRCGKFVQLDLTAPERRLHNFARNHLYAAATATTTTDAHAAAPPPSSRRRYPRPVSLVVHCAGTRGLAPAAAQELLGGDPAAASALDVVDAEAMRRAFDVNVVGALQLARAVLPHLQLHAERVRERQDEVADAFGGSTEWLDQLRQQGSRASLQVARPLPPRDPPPRFVVMGSRMGSVSANAAGGAYAYRASKAALNAVVRSLSIDVPDVCFASVYPGSLKTGMVSVREEPVVSYEESLEAMLPLMDRLGEGQLASGCFVDRFGDPIKF